MRRRLGVEFWPPLRDLTAGSIVPLGLLQHVPQPGLVGLVQVIGGWGPRVRRCLLKGCGASFRPVHWLSRYCSEACREAARRWSRWRASRTYRASERGREARREQSRRYRERVKERETSASDAEACCEGHHQAGDLEKISCSRPGCYELFTAEPRSPLKAFCSSLCRQALRRVRQREARWRRLMRSSCSRGVPGGRKSLSGPFP